MWINERREQARALMRCVHVNMEAGKTDFTCPSLCTARAIRAAIALHVLQSRLENKRIFDFEDDDVICESSRQRDHSGKTALERDLARAQRTADSATVHTYTMDVRGGDSGECSVHFRGMRA